jgi:hypothetical protein
MPLTDDTNKITQQSIQMPLADDTSKITQQSNQMPLADLHKQKYTIVIGSNVV